MEKTYLLTLLSDFGDRDVYVGVIKGVISQINPQITIVDLTHQIPPQNIAYARFCLMNTYPYFPSGTVHLAIVDPGVGSDRRAIAVEFAQGFLIGPDNGIFSGVLSQTPAIQVIELANSDYWLTDKPSQTFHGRDIFAPVAAYIAAGVPLQKLGRELDQETLVRLDIGECYPMADGIVGCVQYIDHFGNLISNIPGSYVQNRNWLIEIQGIRVPGCQAYSDVAPGKPLALVGSHGWIEIAINCGKAQAQWQINPLDLLTAIFV
jgi:S-adenosylmethionine hydrolase